MTTSISVTFGIPDSSGVSAKFANTGRVDMEIPALSSWMIAGDFYVNQEHVPLPKGRPSVTVKLVPQQNSLVVSFTPIGNPPTMQAKFTNSGTATVTVPAFSTFTIGSQPYFNLSGLQISASAVATTTLQKGEASNAGTSITLSTLSVDYNSGKTQLMAMLGTSSAPWKAVLPTETGDTIVSLISTVHASAQQNILRSLQDVFPATAVSDSAIYAAATMQGVRLNRKLPANMPVAVTNNNLEQITIPPYTLFAGANTYWFNRDFITVDPGITVTNYSLYQGVVKTVNAKGLGSPYQLWASQERGFTVSDTDTYAYVNGSAIPKIDTGLWTSKKGLGFVDKTLPTGELLIELGDGVYGSMPMISDNITIKYVVTSGSAANALNALNKHITTTAIQNLVVNAIGNPSGGTDETGALRYKNIAAYSFGTFNSAVNKSQYLTTILEYPGIADAVTFSEREIPQSSPTLMNLIQVTYLLKSGVVWDSVALTRFINYLEANGLYSGRYNIVEPVPVLVPVTALVYCKSWASLSQAKAAATGAITHIFANAGLNYDIMITDITSAILDSYAGIDYVDLAEPSKDAVVSTPWIPAPLLTLGSGYLVAGAVVYAVGYVTANGAITMAKNLSYIVVPDQSSVIVRWESVSSAASYVIYGRGGLGSTWGIVQTVPAGVTTWEDTGVSPVVPPVVNPSALPYNVVAYNKLGDLNVVVHYSQRSGASSTQG